MREKEPVLALSGSEIQEDLTNANLRDESKERELFTLRIVYVIRSVSIFFIENY